MALANIFPGDYYSGDVAKSYDFLGYFDNKRREQEALRNNEINRQAALEDLYHTQQKRPLELRQMELRNLGDEALLPQKQTEGKQAQRNWEVEEGIPIEQRRQQALSKIAREITEDELKSTNAAIEAALVHPSPAVRAQAAQLRGMMSDMMKLREGFQSKADIEEIKAAARTAAAKEASERQLAGIKARAEAARTAAKRDPQTYQAAATRYRILAEDAEDPAVKQQYLNLAAEFEAAGHADKKAGKAGGIDVGAVADLPTTEVKPQLGGSPTAVPKVASGRIIIYKDGKAVGTIPEAQKDQAIKEGYTLK